MKLQKIIERPLIFKSRFDVEIVEINNTRNTQLIELIDLMPDNIVYIDNPIYEVKTKSWGDISIGLSNCKEIKLQNKIINLINSDQLKQLNIVLKINSLDVTGEISETLYLHLKDLQFVDFGTNSYNEEGIQIIELMLNVNKCSYEPI